MSPTRYTTLVCALRRVKHKCTTGAAPLYRARRRHLLDVGVHVAASDSPCETQSAPCCRHQWLRCCMLAFNVPVCSARWTATSLASARWWSAPLATVAVRAAHCSWCQLAVCSATTPSVLPTLTATCASMHVNADVAMKLLLNCFALNHGHTCQSLAVAATARCSQLQLTVERRPHQTVAT